MYSVFALCLLFHLSSWALTEATKKVSVKSTNYLSVHFAFTVDSSHSVEQNLCSLALKNSIILIVTYMTKIVLFHVTAVFVFHFRSNTRPLKRNKVRIAYKSLSYDSKTLSCKLRPIVGIVF